MGERMFQEWRQFLEPLRWYATHSFITAHKMGSKEADARLKSWSAYPGERTDERHSNLRTNNEPELLELVG